MPSNPAAARGAAIGFSEFVVLAAAMMSTQALAIDAMLPALPAIVRELHVADANHGQWIITAYMVGLGIGQLFWGLMSDRFGRRPVLLGGLALYVLAAVCSGVANSFEALLCWRLTHGLAAASVVVTRSVIRDLYSGRHMARVMSLTFMVFLTVPILAPSLGQLLLQGGDLLLLDLDRGDDHAQVAVHLDAVVRGIDRRACRVVFDDEPEASGFGIRVRRLVIVSGESNS